MGNTLRRYRFQEEASGAAATATNSTTAKGDEAASGIFGAALVFEKELTLKVLLLRMLNAENRKMLFVQDGEASGSAPRLLRVLSVSDVWQLLIGGDTLDAEA